MFRRAFRFLISTALVLSPVAFMTGGCTRQAEGERCDFEFAGDVQDCDDGLVCVKCTFLQQREVDRCCRPDGSATDSRCARTLVENTDPCGTHQTGTGGSSSNTGGSGRGGTSGSGGTSGTSGTSGSGGTSGNGDAGGDGDMSNGGSGDPSGAGTGG